MSKKDNRVRNWQQYNRSLIKRGDITCWIDVNSWYCSHAKDKRGRPKSYSNSAILTMVIVKRIYHLTLRSCQGFVESLFRAMNFDKAVPNYSSICRRQKSVTLPKLPTLNGPIHLVVDSSGLKIFGEGEWKVRVHGWTKRRTWKKLHIGVDEKTQLIVSAVLTDNNIGDDKKLSEILNQYQGPIKQVSLDGAYDSHECYAIVHEHGAKPTIPPQPNPQHKPKTLNNLKSPRDHTVWEIQQKGRTQWKIDSGYHRRSLAETCFFRYKAINSGRLRARTPDNQKTEALIGLHILNKMRLEITN